MSSANPSSVKVRVIFVLVVTDGTRKGVSAELITLVSYLTDDDMVVEKCMPNLIYQLVVIDQIAGREDWNGRSASACSHNMMHIFLNTSARISLSVSTSQRH